MLAGRDGDDRAAAVRLCRALAMAPIPERLAGVAIDLATKERRSMDDLIVTAPAKCSPPRHERDPGTIHGLIDWLQWGQEIQS